ncbi:hypothetical protein [Bradyrhizobium sp. 930_D9_N1_4]|uniref:hypothetical protein n=1 Tax=Bradyrhizobium sp. 930_D9_N1_4 TaxID=3240374 RepID=UPI003F8B35FD
MIDVAQAAREPDGYLVERVGDSTFPRLVRTKKEAEGWIRAAELSPKITTRALYAAQPPAAPAGPRYYCQTCCGTGKYDSRMCGLPPEADTTCVDCNGTGIEQPPAAPVETESVLAAAVRQEEPATRNTAALLAQRVEGPHCSADTDKARGLLALADRHRSTASRGDERS